MDSNNTNTSQVYQIILVSAVSITCILSIIGSSAIIFSFLAFRELRNTIRFLLFNLSIADLIVALTNLAGALYSLKFLNSEDQRDKEDPVCVTQAALGILGTDASILWTIVFLVYLYTLLVCYKPRYRTANYVVGIIVTVIVWLTPIVIVAMYTALEYFGYKSQYSPGFCTILIGNTTSEKIREILGYEIFVYASFLILPVFSVLFIIHLGCIVSWHVSKNTSQIISFFFHLFQRKRHLSDGLNMSQYLRIMQSAELKLVLIPVSFLLIRVWSLVLDIWVEYIGTPPKTTTRDVLVVLAVSIYTCTECYHPTACGLYQVYIVKWMRARLHCKLSITV